MVNKVMLYDGMIRSPQGRLRAADSQRMSQYAPSMALYFLVEPNETRSNYPAIPLHFALHFAEMTNLF